MIPFLKKTAGLGRKSAAGDLRLLAHRYQEQLKARKEAIEGIDWYPYHSFGLFDLWPEIAAPERQDMRALAGTQPVLDVGCGDGDLSFFLESLGCRVEMVDYGQTNYNGLRGATALKQSLGSQATITSLDLDSQFGLPRGRYGLILCLGVLYHLKNPYYVLETLAEAGYHCLLSTRVAAATPTGERLADLPVAYLLNRNEANQDWTNYWIFSETGLRRVLDRTGWDVLDWHVTACEGVSDPSANDRDQRVYCLLRSRAWHPCEVEIGSGWHELEEGRWRWTAPRFSVVCQTGQRLRLEFELADRLMPAAGSVTVEAASGGMRVSCECATPGHHVLEVPLKDLPAEVEFTVRNLQQAPGDDRDLGLIVAFFPTAGLRTD